MFRKQLDYAEAGDNAGILLRGTKKDEVNVMGIVKPGSIKLHSKFTAKVYILKKKKVAVTHQSCQVTVHNSTLEQLM